MKENEYAVKCTELILGGIILDGTMRGDVRAYSEVPRYSHQDHMDLLIIDRGNELLLNVEYKIGNVKELTRQLNHSVVGSVGITTGKLSEDRYSEKFYCIARVKSFSDSEIENMLQVVDRKYNWTSIYSSSKAMMYYYAYMNMETDFKNCGSKNCKRESFYRVYRRAIKNLYNEIGDKITLRIALGMFGCYSETTAKKHYRKAMLEIEDGNLN